MSMAIYKTDYEDKKAYWDYQRLLEYNRELLKQRLAKMQGSVFTQLGPMDTGDLYDKIWTDIRQEDLEKPPSMWVPEEPKWRFEWEGEPWRPQLPKPKKGRPVVLRAKHIDDLND